jgi:hypothetical protein
VEGASSPLSETAQGQDAPATFQPTTEFIHARRSLGEGEAGRNPEVEKISWSKNTVWVDKTQTTGFKGVREDVWNFHIGGYQVCEKWLKDRKGRTLTKDDVTHYHRIVIALAETIRLMTEIDGVIANHGGWPGAFACATTTAPAYEASAREETLAFAAEEQAPYGAAKQSDLGIRTEDELPLG